MRVALYVRVSSEKQEVDLSVAAQLKALREYAEKQGHAIVKEFIDEAESGRSGQRPKFQEMIHQARQKRTPFDGILVWKLSRFARSREDSIIYKSLLRKHGVQVISINEPIENSPTGRMIEGMIETMDEFYSDNMAQDIARGTREAASRGFWVCAMTPYGYRRSKVPDGGKYRIKLEIDAASSQVVQRIFRLAAEGAGTKEVAKALNRDGIPSPRGKRWGRSMIHAMLTNEVYTGMLVWGLTGEYHNTNGKEPIRVPGAVPALVDRAIFDAIRANLKARAPKVQPPRRVSSPYLLSGLIRCGTCGAAMTGVSAKSGRFHYYVCATAHRVGGDSCKEKAVPQELVENQVLAKIRELILREEHIEELVRLTNEELKASLKNAQGRLATMKTQEEEIEARLARLYDALETGKLELDDIAPRIRDLRQRQELVQRVRGEVVEAMDERKLTLVDRESVLGYLKEFRTLLNQGSIADRRVLLKSFVSDVIKRGQMLTVHYTLPMPPEELTLGDQQVLTFDQSGGRYWIRTSDPFLVKEML